MHELQKIILKRLLNQNGLKYGTLAQGYNYEDNIVFHIKKLISGGLVEKRQSKYFLTTEGAKKITNYDLPTLADTGFKTFFIGFLIKEGDNYLIKEHPNGNNNFYNLPSGKPKFGENINKALVRTFYENTGININAGDFKHISLHLKTVKTPVGETLFDDAFAIYEVEINAEKKNRMKLAKKIRWLSVREIKKLKDRWPEIDILIIKKNRTNYLTYEFTSNYSLME